MKHCMKNLAYVAEINNKQVMLGCELPIGFRQKEFQGENRCEDPVSTVGRDIEVGFDQGQQQKETRGRTLKVCFGSSGRPAAIFCRPAAGGAGLD
jgi:hypothetical protein